MKLLKSICMRKWRTTNWTRFYFAFPCTRQCQSEGCCKLESAKYTFEFTFVAFVYVFASESHATWADNLEQWDKPMVTWFRRFTSKGGQILRLVPDVRLPAKVHRPIRCTWLHEWSLSWVGPPTYPPNGYNKQVQKLDLEFSIAKI